MADIDLKTETPDTSLPSTGFLFGADSQSAASPSVYSTQAVATALLGSTSLTGSTVTADSPVLNLAQTWNNSGVTFTGLKANVTDTASSASSLLMDLQVGGNSAFKIEKSLTGLAFSVSAGRFTITTGQNVTALTSNFGLLLSSNNSRLDFGVGADVSISRRAAANLRLGAADAAAPVAQTLSVQSVVAGTTNTAGANLTITGSQGTGTGAGGSIVFQVAPAGSTGSAQNALADALIINSAGLLQFAGTISSFPALKRSSAALQVRLADDSGYATFDCGPLNAYSGVTFRGSTEGTRRLTWNNIGAIRAQSDGVFTWLNDAGTDFNRLQFGGTTSSFPALKRSSTTLQARLADDSAFASVQGKLTTDTAYTAGDPTTTGYLVVYDSTGAAFKIPAVAV